MYLKKNKGVYFTASLVSHVTDTASKMVEKPSLSVTGYWSYIKVCVILGQSATEILFELQSASPLSAPSKATVFQWMKHFQSGKSSSFNSRGKKCNEELVAHVKAMIDEDACILLEETASTLISQTEKVSSTGKQLPLKEQMTSYSMLENAILCIRFGNHKVYVRWIPHILMPQ